MTIKSNVRSAVAIGIFSLLAITFQSCKKTNDNPFSDPAANPRSTESIKADIESRIKQMGGVPQVFPIHQKENVEWRDENGKKVDPQTTSANRGGGGCTNFDDPDYVNLLQYQRIYSCNSNSGAGGYVIQWQYEISWSKVVTPVNSSSVPTQGVLHIINNSTSAVDKYIYENGTVVDLGPDPVYAPHHKYLVTFQYGDPLGSCLSSQFVDGTGSTTYSMSFGASFATTCPDSYSLWTIPAVSQGYTGSTGIHPCKRADFVYFLYPSSHTFGVASYDILSVCNTYGGSYPTKPDLVQVQYSLDGAAFIPFPVAGGTANPIQANGYLQQFSVSYTNAITPGVHDVVIRYRNWKYAVVPSPLTVPNPSVDCHSEGDSADPHGYGSWAYEYHYNITI